MVVLSLSKNMSDKEYFSHLYEIAANLNREFSLPAALRVALEKTVQLLNLETGWIWLVQADVKSVYLAASYNLPPALSNHPERLSGWCFCIEKYLSDDIAKGRNISEIACSRLKNIKSGTRDLKFHATIPITTQGQKVGLINLVSRETQQLDEQATITAQYYLRTNWYCYSAYKSAGCIPCKTFRQGNSFQRSNGKGASKQGRCIGNRTSASKFFIRTKQHIQRAQSYTAITATCRGTTTATITHFR